MATQRRFGLAYQESYAAAGARRNRHGCRKGRARRLALRIRTAILQLGDEYLDALLDEEFDELSCEPGVLLRLTNQL